MGWKGDASTATYGLGEMVPSIAVGVFANIRGIVTYLEFMYFRDIVMPLHTVHRDFN
jgi:hypothetical protein